MLTRHSIIAAILALALSFTPVRADPALPGVSDGGVWLVPASATTVSFAGKDGGGGLLMYPLGGGPPVMTFISPGGIPGNDLSSTWEDGNANVALLANTLYHVYVWDTDNPKLEFSQTGPNVNGDGLVTKTGNNTRRYVGVLYTLDLGGGIDVSFQGHTGPLRAVVHSEFNSQPLMLQTGNIVTQNFSSTAQAHINPALSAHIVMRATHGFSYEVNGRVVATQSAAGQTFMVSAINATNGDIKDIGGITVPSVIPGGPFSIGISSVYGQALPTGYFHMSAVGRGSGAAVDLWLSATVWVNL